MLRTEKEEGRTLVRTDAARAWLQAKGRYVPITRQWRGVDLDLAKTKFDVIDQLHDALANRMEQLRMEHQDCEDLPDRVYAAFSEHGYEPQIELTAKGVEDQGLLTALATLLRLPVNLLALRARQAWLNTELVRVGRDIQESVSASTGPAA